MRRRTAAALFSFAVVGAGFGALPADEAAGRTCARVDTTVTTLGDPSCTYQDPNTHVCVLREEDPFVVACVEMP